MNKTTPIGQCDGCKQSIFWNQRVAASLAGMFHQKCLEGSPDVEVDRDPGIVPVLDQEDSIKP